MIMKGKRKRVKRQSKPTQRHRAPARVTIGDNNDLEEGQSSDDAEFVTEELKTGGMKFLSKMDFDAEPSNSRKKRRRVTEEDDMPRLWDNGVDTTKMDDEELHYLLPLKDENKIIQQKPVKLEKIVKVQLSDSEDDVAEHQGGTHSSIGSDNDSIGSESEPEGSGEVTRSTELSAAQLLLLKEKRIQTKKTKVNQLTSQILEDPQTNVSLLSKLRRYSSDSTPEISVRKVSMVSLLTIYKDIVPGYSIRELTEKEKSVKVSKDVKKLRDFEQTLLTCYKHYIQLLEKTINDEFHCREKKKAVVTDDALFEDDNEDPFSKQSVGDVALYCLCELACSLHHFNYHGDIFSALVKWMAVPPIKVSRKCCDAVSNVFKNDSIGGPSLEIVQLMTKMIKGRGYNIPNEVIRTFLSLQLNNVEEPVNQLGVASDTARINKEQKLKRKMEAKKMTRKQRRKYSMMNRLERELKEIEVEERQEKKSKLQTECIKMVFFIYFRILKHSPNSFLLTDVLEGLAKYSHLISVDYFSDLMSVLQEIMTKQNLSSCNVLRCVYTCFEILSGQGESLNIDPRTFYCQLYTNILHLDYYSTHDDAMMVLQCLEKMIKRRRQVSIQRVCAFIKRLSSISLQLSSGIALGVMTTIRLLIQTYPSPSSALLENDDTPASVFRPEVSDPELSGAQSTLLWELATLTKHFDPQVSGYAQHLIKGAPSQGVGSLNPSFSQRLPSQLIKQYSWHELDPLAGVSDTISTKKLKQATPITLPRTYESYLQMMKD